jgi:hypothetical protein
MRMSVTPIHETKCHLFVDKIWKTQQEVEIGADNVPNLSWIRDK